MWRPVQILKLTVRLSPAFIASCPVSDTPVPKTPVKDLIQLVSQAHNEFQQPWGRTQPKREKTSRSSASWPILNYRYLQRGDDEKLYWTQIQNVIPTGFNILAECKDRLTKLLEHNNPRGLENWGPPCRQMRPVRGTESGPTVWLLDDNDLLGPEENAYFNSYFLKKRDTSYSLNVSSTLPFFVRIVYIFLPTSLEEVLYTLSDTAVRKLLKHWYNWKPVKHSKSVEQWTKYSFPPNRELSALNGLNPQLISILLTTGNKKEHHCFQAAILTHQT
jgi:hypothetical protein